jgi:peptidoglycan/xylan/chitin deacetylase (PgdA/CDA1 family)
MGLYKSYEPIPQILLTFDDSYRSQFRNVHAYATAKGVPVTYYIMPGETDKGTGVDEKLKHVDLLEIAKTGMHSIGMHDSVNWDTRVTALGEQGLKDKLLADIDIVNQYTGHGKFFSWPEGNLGTTSLANAQALQRIVRSIFTSGRHIITGKAGWQVPPIYPSHFEYHQIRSRYLLDNQATSTAALTAIDNAILNNETLFFYAHHVEDTHTTETASITVVKEVIDHIATKVRAGDCEAVTHPDWYQRSLTHAGLTLTT